MVVTTGQQPGLFGGPIYTWSKAMSALALADRIEAATGVPTAAIFWAATDDADFAEAASTVVARVGGAHVLSATLTPPAGTPLSLAPLGDLTTALRLLRDASGSAADVRPLDAVDAAYGAPARSAGDAYVLLLRELLAPLGMPVLDASHPAVRAASDPTLRAALRGARDIEAALATRSAELRAAGYAPQVEDVAGLSLVFTRQDGIKRRLTVQAAAGATDGWFTPNVLLRPVVERAILPTIAYVAGPGELAYFAQVGAVASAIGVDRPLAVPRWSCTIVEPQVQALLARYSVDVQDLATPDALESRVARQAMDPATATTLSHLRSTIASLPAELEGESGPIGLSAAVEGATSALQHRVDRLERRLLAGIKRREVARMRDVATLRAALFPHGVRQERRLNAIPLFARQGMALLGAMREAAQPHAAALIVGDRTMSTTAAGRPTTS